MKEYYILLENYKYVIIKSKSIKRARNLAIKIYGDEVSATLSSKAFYKFGYDKDYTRRVI